MRLISSIIKTFRLANVLLIAVAQFFTAYFLDVHASMDWFLNEGKQTFKILILFIAATAAVTSFGYWINDITDKKRDQINKPGKNRIEVIGNTTSAVIAGLLGLFTVTLAWFMPPNFLWIFSTIIVLLIVYSLFLKNLPFVGNLLVAALCFASIYLIIKIVVDADLLLVLHFATLAALITLAREMIKDMEDQPGDELDGARTVPIAFGLETSKGLSRMVLVTCLSFGLISAYYLRAYFRMPLEIVFLAYYLFFIIIPLFITLQKLNKAKIPSDFKLLSLWCKYVLLTGILSMLLF